MPQQYLDFLLIRDLYHCPPSALEQENSAVLNMHREFMRIDLEQQELNRKRAEQRARAGAKK